MKYLLKSVFFFGTFAITIALNAQFLYNKENKLVVAANTYLVISGSYRNLPNSSLAITSGGTVKISGDLYNDATSTLDFGNGIVHFNGSGSPQIIGGTSTANHAVAFYNCMYNSNGIKLAKNVIVNNNINITNGILYTGEDTLSLSSSATITGGSSTSFIDGKLKKSGNGAAFTFQTGDVQSGVPIWAPIQIDSWNNTNDFIINYTYKSIYDSLGIHTWQDGVSLGTGLAKISGKEFWLVDRAGAGTQTPAITLYWKNALNSLIEKTSPYDGDTLSDLALVHWNGTQWSNMGGTAGGTWPAGQITSSFAFAGYSPVSFGSKTGKNPLPIEILDFSARCSSNKIIIYWQTATETNNSHFLLERSTDALLWNEITSIDGAGNSNQLLQYSYIDTDVSEDGVYYYRLVSIDLNGTAEYSKIIFADCYNIGFDIISIYPNPVIKGDMFYLVCSSENSNIETFVTDILGQVLFYQKHKIEKGVTLHRIDVSNLGSAIYFLKVSTNNGMYKMSKQFVID
ncbi:MAG: hypothetical protein A2275_10590 [Bacteroidetes bacterium RIFOXYA12_FULL_35_11]|nr:MAG: hypothetical protein A2X01_19895 [Bacteroidetes bacterium GWF2_35_48]OFY76386.1 MAG: hypothetical protein A2275_10590 [Bacteroidetes bacterium RIFOXYA12_FULL_35_11]OFY93326.1 MAG: hypothetical protein A2309_03850 [Bacteroidetes bacterium RIFOXYB2_FULL_35_7]OFZ00050.1 MAG: hypothetical protein A2491_21305 [Bacteroidetes bacterium RIFOXYC12_FULL_35_7]HBX53293.1 hypothetical protein [Bacteroidales bacterium]